MLPVWEVFAFRIITFDIFKALVPSNDMSYGPNFNCGNSSWSKLPENGNPPLWRHRLHTLEDSHFLRTLSAEWYISAYSKPWCQVRAWATKLLSLIGLFQILQTIPVLSAIKAVCFRRFHLLVTAQQEVTPPPSWLPCQNAFPKGCLYEARAVFTRLCIKSIFR